MSCEQLSRKQVLELLRDYKDEFQLKSCTFMQPNVDRLPQG